MDRSDSIKPRHPFKYYVEWQEIYNFGLHFGTVHYHLGFSCYDSIMLHDGTTHTNFLKS